MQDQRDSSAPLDATRELRWALRHLDEPAQLCKSPLTRLAMVRAHALAAHGGEPNADGLALRELLMQTIVQVDHVLVEMATGDADSIRRMRQVLRGLARGDSVASLARSFGLDPASHISRTLYQVHNTLVRTFLERVGHMAIRQDRPASVDQVRAIA